MTKDRIKVSLSVPSKFHSFNVAKRLNEQGCLQQLITPYPYFEIRKYGIPKNKVNTIIIREVLQKLYGKMPW